MGTHVTDYQWHRVNAARLRGEAIGNAFAALAQVVRSLWRHLTRQR